MSEYECQLDITAQPVCTHKLSTGDTLTAILDGQEASVTISARDENYDFGATLIISVDDEKEPDIILRPDQSKAVTYRIQARKVEIENDSQNEGVDVLVSVKENAETETQTLFIHEDE